MSRNHVFNNLVNGAKNTTPSCVFLNRNIRKFCQTNYNTAGNVSLTAYGTGFQRGNVGPGIKMMKRLTPNSSSKISCTTYQNSADEDAICYSCMNQYGEVTDYCPLNN